MKTLSVDKAIGIVVGAIILMTIVLYNLGLVSTF